VRALVNFQPGPFRQFVTRSVQEFKGLRVDFYVKDFQSFPFQVKAIPDFYDIHIWLTLVVFTG
jgi:hypothetical protein